MKRKRELQEKWQKVECEGRKAGAQESFCSAF